MERTQAYGKKKEISYLDKKILYFSIHCELFLFSRI